MKYVDINNRFTQIVAEYIGKGYTINTASMSGNQGEVAKIDLTNGIEIIRVMVSDFSDWETVTEGVEIIVGRSTDDVQPNDSDRMCRTVWTRYLEILSTERFYKLGADRNHGIYYGSEEEAQAATEIRRQRYIAREIPHKTRNLTEHCKELSKRVIRRKFGITRIREADIHLSEFNGAYTVGYRNKTYRLH